RDRPLRTASAALARRARLASAPAAGAAAARADQREALDLDGLLGLALLRGVGRAGGLRHGSLLETGACSHFMPLRTGASTAHRCSRTTGRAPSSPRGGYRFRRRTSRRNRGNHPSVRPGPGALDARYGWMSGWSSSACSPVTRKTTRFATATAWSA